MESFALVWDAEDKFLSGYLVSALIMFVVDRVITRVTIPLGVLSTVSQRLLLTLQCFSWWA